MAALAASATPLSPDESPEAMQQRTWDWLSEQPEDAAELAAILSEAAPRLRLSRDDSGSGCVHILVIPGSDVHDRFPKSDAARGSASRLNSTLSLSGKFLQWKPVLSKDVQEVAARSPGPDPLCVGLSR